MSPTPHQRQTPDASFPEAVRRILYLLSPRERVRLFVLFLIMVVAAALEMIGIGAIPAFVVLVTDPDRLFQYELARAAREALGLEEQGQLVLVGASLLLLLFVGKNLFLAGVAYAQARFLHNRSAAIARRLFRAYIRSPYPFHLRRNSVELLRNVSNESQRAVAGVLTPILHLTREGLVVAAIAGLLLYVDPFVSLAVFLGLGAVSVGFYRSVRRKVSFYGKQGQIARGRLMQAVNEGLGAVKELKVLGRERLFEKRLAESTARIAVAQRFNEFLGQLPRLFLESAALLGLLVVATLFIVQGRSLQAMLPFLALLAVAVVRLIPSFNQLTSAATQMRFNLPAVEAVFSDLRALESRLPAERVSQVSLPRFSSSITLRDVHFTYPGGAAEVLRGIELEIPAGAAVAFVGPTGAGKTTLVDIILGLLEPTRGKVLVDGRDLREAVAGWQRQIGYVPQQIYLSDDTLRRNIAFGLEDSDIQEERVVAAVRDAQLEEFVRQLPKGLDTYLGERGIRISGGQRQRVGIARALYHDPPVLVLDEATSSLDNETETYVMEAINRLRGNRTLIIIAHRLTTVRNCDRLFFLYEGRLEASGAFDELLASSDRFRRMAGETGQAAATIPRE